MHRHDLAVARDQLGIDGDPELALDHQHEMGFRVRATRLIDLVAIAGQLTQVVVAPADDPLNLAFLVEKTNVGNAAVWLAVNELDAVLDTGIG